MTVLTFACNSKACAPPPAGHGGSNPSGGSGTRPGHRLSDDLDDSFAPGVKTGSNHQIDDRKRPVTSGREAMKRFDHLATDVHKGSGGSIGPGMTATHNYDVLNANNPGVMSGREMTPEQWTQHGRLTKVRVDKLQATEEAVKSKHIQKVLDGEPLREGYDPQVIKGRDGKLYVADGNTRVAMHHALGKKSINVRIIDEEDAVNIVHPEWSDKPTSKVKVFVPKGVAPDDVPAGTGKRSHKLTLNQRLNGLFKGLSPRSADFDATVLTFACHSKDCAPPPAGKGGSSKAHSDAHRHAVRILNSARKVEGNITKDIKEVTEAHGGEMAGLDHSLKGVDSLRRKIHDKAITKGITIDDSASRITDAIRYTAVLPTDNYTHGVQGVIGTLKEKGYEINSVENHWLRGDAYNGLHLLAKHPSGDIAELQFHTPESLAAKRDIHGLYEEYRQLDTPPTRRLQLFNQMVKVSDTAPIPVGIRPIGLKIKRPHES